MIVGLGTDLVGIERIAAVHQRQGSRFLNRVYTPAEQAYCLAARAPGERLAARWAAKEATMKALGTGWAKGVTFTSIEVVPAGDGQPPSLRLHGPAAARAQMLGATRWHVSLSHSDGLAIATVILEMLGPETRNPQSETGHS
jgi:holo-[acyl-carrier protein] synthase